MQLEGKPANEADNWLSRAMLFDVSPDHLIDRIIRVVLTRPPLSIFTLDLLPTLLRCR